MVCESLCKYKPHIPDKDYYYFIIRETGVMANMDGSNPSDFCSTRKFRAKVRILNKKFELYC